MKLRYAFKRTIANKSAGADKELKPEVPDGMLKKCLYLSALRQLFPCSCKEKNRNAGR